MTVAEAKNATGQSAVPLPQREMRQGFPFVGVAVGFFIFATLALVQFNVFVRITGYVLAFAFLVYWVSVRLPIGAEVFLYFVWVLWSATGLVVSVSTPVFWYRYGTVFQIWGLLLILAGFTQSRRLLSWNMLAFLLGAAVVGGYSFVTGEYQRALREGERVAGLVLGANGFAWVMILSTVAAAYFWMLPSRRRRPLKRVVLASLMGAVAIATALTGSRKGIVALVAFYVFWWWFCYRKLDIRRWWKFVLAFVLLAAFGAGYVLFISEMPVAERFEASWNALLGRPTARATGMERLGLYRTGWELFKDNLLVGVGLNQFRFYTPTGLVAHSEYMEVLCDTGLIGALLYFAVFVVFWRKAGKIRKYSQNPTERQIAGLSRALILTVMLLNFGMWHYDSKWSWVIFASFIGYQTAVWSRIRQRLAAGRGGAAMPEVQPRPPASAAVPAGTV